MCFRLTRLTLKLDPDKQCFSTLTNQAAAALRGPPQLVQNKDNDSHIRQDKIKNKSRVSNANRYLGLAEKSVSIGGLHLFLYTHAILTPIFQENWLGVCGNAVVWLALVQTK